MMVRRVFVIWINPLFYESVRLLLQHPEIDWVGATADRAAVPAEIASRQPDTVLVEVEEARDSAAEVLEILGAAAADVRVFLLGLADNQLLIYHREQKTVGQAQDLVRLIQEQSVGQPTPFDGPSVTGKETV